MFHTIPSIPSLSSDSNIPKLSILVRTMQNERKGIELKKQEMFGIWGPQVVTTEDVFAILDEELQEDMAWECSVVHGGVGAWLAEHAL